jgi:GH24 family phage-related lysozyme (muramidase)
MKTSEHGVKLIEQREGIRFTVYLDTKKIPTVGVGHVVLPQDNLKVGDRITQEQCDAFLEHDLGKCEAAVNAVGVELTQWQFDALVSLVFNIGEGEGGFLTSTVRKDLVAKNYKAAAEAILMWNEPPEIRGRRRTEYNQFREPDYFYKSSAAGPSPTSQDDVRSDCDPSPDQNSTGDVAGSQVQPPTHHEAVGGGT